MKYKSGETYSMTRREYLAKWGRFTLVHDYELVGSWMAALYLFYGLPKEFKKVANSLFPECEPFLPEEAFNYTGAVILLNTLALSCIVPYRWDQGRKDFLYDLVDSLEERDNILIMIARRRGDVPADIQGYLTSRMLAKYRGKTNQLSCSVFYPDSRKHASLRVRDAHQLLRLMGENG